MARGRKAQAAGPPLLGYRTGFSESYELGREVGRGGNGVVYRAVHRFTGRSVAVKSIPKELKDPSASERKKADQIPYLKREVEVLLALRGTLNVANLEEVYEDSTHVHLVLELCTGGELLARTAAGRHYGERTAASFLRAVLRTVAQCHAKRVIHRDVKPGNFLFLSEDEAAPIKGIDFGLAVFFDPRQLPVTGLNPEGTPWYLAPECCRAKWYPQSDVWAAGVMACYLLTGTYPFLDRFSPKMPDLARTLRSICFDELDLSRKEFQGLSDPAKAFIAALLVKDPLARPSAADALRHPFLRGSAAERSTGAALDRTVVQRIQRFAQSSLFKRSVLEHIAADLLTMHFAPTDASTHGGAVFKDRSTRGGMAFKAAAAAAREGSVRGGDRSLHGGEGSAHGRRVGFRGAASAALAAVRLERSVRGGDRSVRGGALLEASVRGGTAGLYLPVATPYSHRLAQLFDRLRIRPGQKIDRRQLQAALEEIGYQLQEAEVGELFDAVDVERRGELSRAELAAGLIDWKAFQDTYKDRWLELARRAFAELDAGNRGSLEASDIAAAFGSHLSPYEVDAAVHQALLEATGSLTAAALDARAGSGGSDGGEAAAAAPPVAPAPLDFDHFLGMLRSGSGASLELFDDRLSNHTSRLPTMRGDDLQPVPPPQPRGTGGRGSSGGGGGPACCTIT